MVSYMILLITIVAVLIVVSILIYRKYRIIRIKYSPILDLDAELEKIRKEIKQLQDNRDKFKSKSEEQQARLTQEYETAISTFSSLKKEISLLEENLEDLSYGFYKPHFSFQTSDEYKNRLIQIREQEKKLMDFLNERLTPVKEECEIREVPDLQ